MQAKRMKTESRLRIARTSEDALTANWSEHRPGYCELCKKHVLRRAGVPEELRTESAGSARQAFAEYEELGLAMPVGTVAQIGDILYWVRDGDGKHGHVAIKVRVDRYNENSTVHCGPGDKDARGWRYLSGHPGYRVVRLWETP